MAISIKGIGIGSWQDDNNDNGKNLNNLHLQTSP